MSGISSEIHKFDLSGCSILNQLGYTFDSIKLNIGSELLLADISENEELEREVVEEVKRFQARNPKATNGSLLGNPKFNVIDPVSGQIDISVRPLRYFTYYALIELASKSKIAKACNALSTCCVIFDRVAKVFYFSLRPVDSPENAGKIDAAGGVLDPESPQQADPFLTAKNRVEKKLGLTNLNPKCLGITGIFDQRHALYNLVMYAEVAGNRPTVDSALYTAISLGDIDRFFGSDTMTTPTKIAVMLALGQDTFLADGWGQKKVASLIKIDNHV